MAICGSWIVIGRVWSRRPPGERAGSKERRCGLLASCREIVRAPSIGSPRFLGCFEACLLAYDRAGPAGALPIVLLHAGIADRRMWDPLWDGLTAERDAIRLDLRGFGESVAKPAGALDPVADVLATLADVPQRSISSAPPTARAWPSSSRWRRPSASRRCC